MPSSVSVIIPAHNEELSISAVIAGLKSSSSEIAELTEIIVVDNGSSDRTAEVASAAGAIVVSEPALGYGAACLRGIASQSETEVVLFVDGDLSDNPKEWPSLVEPVVLGQAELVIGSRTLGVREHGALLPQARFGNWLATRLIKFIYHHTYTDLGPFRAITRAKLVELKMQDRSFGWTVEMQLKALRYKLKVLEVPVSYRKRRTGVSKVTGSIKGSTLAGAKILELIFRELYSGEPR